MSADTPCGRWQGTGICQAECPACIDGRRLPQLGQRTSPVLALRRHRARATRGPTRTLSRPGEMFPNLYSGTS